MSENRCPVCLSEIGEGENSCPVCHFNLAGATQSFKPLSMKQDPAEKPTQSEIKATLRMVRGPKLGSIYELDKDKITLGRNPQCDIFLNDMTVSREHAEIIREADAYIISDLQSFNGVWVNNRTVSQHVLRPDDYVQIGKFDFVYEESEA